MIYIRTYPCYITNPIQKNPLNRKSTYCTGGGAGATIGSWGRVSISKSELYINNNNQFSMTYSAPLTLHL